MTVATNRKNYTVCQCGWEYIDAMTSSGRKTVEVQIIDPDCYNKGVRAVDGKTWDIRYISPD